MKSYFERRAGEQRKSKRSFSTFHPMLLAAFLFFVALCLNGFLALFYQLGLVNSASGWVVMLFFGPILLLMTIPLLTLHCLVIALLGATSGEALAVFAAKLNGVKKPKQVVRASSWIDARPRSMGFSAGLFLAGAMWFLGVTFITWFLARPGHPVMLWGVVPALVVVASIVIAQMLVGAMERRHSKKSHDGPCRKPVAYHSFTRRVLGGMCIVGYILALALFSMYAPIGLNRWFPF